MNISVIPVRLPSGPGQQVATAAALSGAAAMSALWVVWRDIQSARQQIHSAAPTWCPYTDRLYGGSRRGTSIRIAVLGDSLAAGYGAGTPDNTVAGRLAAAVVQRFHRPVRLSNVASVGATSASLPAQALRVSGMRPHIAIVIVGANDVTHALRPSMVRKSTKTMVETLRRTGTESILIATCPDLGAVPVLSGPLRACARAYGRAVAAEQSRIATRFGCEQVSLARTLGRRFLSHPELMFGPDQFHPSPAGYAAAAKVLESATLGRLETVVGGRRPKAKAESAAEFPLAA